MTRHVGKFRGQKRHIEMNCPCASTFRVSLEFRRAERKQTHIEGFYAKLPENEDWGMMLVRNISRTGIGLLTYGQHRLNAGDELKVKFALDDNGKSEIEKRAVVRWVQDIHIGCEFMKPVEQNDTYSASLHAYLPP